jgi:hypothetical protein
MKPTPLDQVTTITGYYGLKAIAKRMGWSPFRVKNMAIRYSFPIVRMPSKTARGWLYYTNDNLILAWFAGLQLNTRRYLLATKRTGSAPIREERNAIEQVADNTHVSSTQQGSCVQPASDVPATSNDNASDISGLGGRGEQQE